MRTVVWWHKSRFFEAGNTKAYRGTTKTVEAKKIEEFSLTQGARNLGFGHRKKFGHLVFEVDSKLDSYPLFK